jgi:hypothetical protein
MSKTFQRGDRTDHIQIKPASSPTIKIEATAVRRFIAHSYDVFNEKSQSKIGPFILRHGQLIVVWTPPDSENTFEFSHRDLDQPHKSA